MKNQGGLLERLVGGSGYLGILGLAFMVVSISYDVILRYVFYAPTYWALEMNTFLLAFLCLIPAGDVLRFGSQIRTHYPLETATEVAIMRQEARPMGTANRGNDR